MVSAGDWLRRVIYRGLRIGGMVHGIRAETRFCAICDLPDHCRCAGARLRGKGGRIEKKTQRHTGRPEFVEPTKDVIPKSPRFHQRGEGSGVESDKAHSCGRTLSGSGLS